MNTLQALPDPDIATPVNNLTPLPDPDAVPDITFQQAPEEAVKEQPGFMKKLDMINTGVNRGVTHFTLALMSKLPFGKSYQEGIKNYDAEVEAEQQHNKDTYSGYYPQVGEVGGELLATAPLGGVFGGVVKAGKLAGEMAPLGLKTISKYGVGAVGATEAAALQESQRYDPENPGQLFNQEAAKGVLENPGMAALAGAAGVKMGTWLDASRKLGGAKEILPNIMARNLKEPGATTTLSNMFFGIPSALTGMGKQAKQVDQIGDDISSFIQKIAGTKEAQTADNLTEYSANIIQSTLKKMGRAEDKIWDQGFKVSPITNPQAVKDDVINAIDLLKTNKIPGYETTVNYLNNGLRKGEMKVEDVKKLQTLVSGAAINAKSLEGGVGNQLADELGNIKDSLLNHIQGSLSPDAMKDFSTAREFSSRKFELFKNAPLLQKALYDDASAHKLVNTLISEGGVLPPKKAALNILSDGGRDMVGATKLQQALESSDTAGHINLDTFLTKTSPYTQTKTILNKGAYNALEGLNKYLKNIDEASKVGWWRQAAIAGTVASSSAAGGLTAGATGLAIPLVAYGAASLIANHSPLKSILGALTKNLPKSTYDNLVKAAEKHFTRLGVVLTPDGVLEHKDIKRNKGNQ